MGDYLAIGHGIRIPISEIELRASRSGGPGGQHANKTASRIEATFDVRASTTLSDAQKSRIAGRLGPRVTAVSQDSRGQARNRETALERLGYYQRWDSGYAKQQATRPQTLGYGLADSPVAFAAFMYDYNGGEPQHSLTKDEVLDNVTLYWFTNTAVSSARLYWESKLAFFAPKGVAIPVAVIGTISAAARRGVIVRDPGGLEQLTMCRTMILDKTGTLTYGRPTLSDELYAPIFTRESVLPAIAGNGWIALYGPAKFRRVRLVS